MSITGNESLVFILQVKSPDRLYSRAKQKSKYLECDGKLIGTCKSNTLFPVNSKADVLK